MILSALLFKKRLALWALGQALPDSDALKPYVRVALLGVMAAAAIGGLIALTIVGLLAGLYLYLISEGVGLGMSIFITAASGLLVILIGYLFAERKIDRLSHVGESISLFSHEKNDVIADTFNLIVNGFVDGLFNEKKPSSSPHTATEKAEESPSDVIFHPKKRAV